MSSFPLSFTAGLPFGLSLGTQPAAPRDSASTTKRKRKSKGANADANATAASADSYKIGRVHKNGKATRPAEIPLDQRTDELLLRDYVQGETVAFQEVMGRYRNELLHFLIRFLGSRAAAEDVFQETFLQIHLSADTFDVTRRFKPWLFTIAANKARDYHRKHNRRNTVSLSNTVGEDEGDQFVDLLQADLPGPAEPILDAERSKLVKTVLDSMPLHLREIILLSYFQRLSYNQIAESLEIPLGTVKSRLHAAVANFAKAWKAAMAREGRNETQSSAEVDFDDERNEEGSP